MSPVSSLERPPNGRPDALFSWPGGLDPYLLVLLTAVVLRLFQVGMDLMSPDDVCYSNAMGSDFAYNPYNVTGRYTSKLLYDVLLFFGVNIIFASYVLFLVETALLVLSFRYLADVFGFRLDPFRLYLAGCLFCLHPYLAENYYLRFESFRFLYLLMPLGGIAWYAAGRLGPAVVALLLAAALAINQQAVNVYFAVVLLHWGLAGKRARPFGLLAAGVAGVGLYLAAILFFEHVLGIRILYHVGQGTYLSPGAVGQRLAELAELGRDLLLSNEPLMTPSQSVILGLYGLAGLWAFLRRSGDARRAAGLFALAVCACFGIFAVLEEWFPSYRNDTAFVVLLTVLVCCLFERPGRATQWAARGFVLVMVGLAASNAAFTASTMRINTVNALWAERIVARLEAQPEFQDIRRVALVGCAPCVVPNIPVARYGINFHSGCVEWSRLPLINHVSGFKCAEATPQDDRAAREYCSRTGEFPAAGSVAVLGDLGVVCLTP